jgi:hypothetical protein
MASKEIEFKIKVINDSGEIVEKTTKSIGEAEEAVKKLNEAAKKADYGSDKWKQLDESAKNIQGQVDKTTRKTETLGESLGKIQGPIGGVVQGFTGLGQAAKAFIANPIGLVVAALGAIFAAVSKAIKNSEAAMDSITKIMAIFGGIVRPIFEFIENVAVASLDALASGLETVAGWFGGTASEAGKLADALDNAEDKEKDLAVSRAETNKQLAESRELLSDNNASLEQRQAALKKVQAAENAQSKQEVANKRELLRLAEQELKLNGASEEAIQKVRNAKIALSQTEQDAAAKQRQFNKQQKALDKEAEAAKDEENKKAQERAKEFAANRKAAQDKIRALDQANLLASIKDEEARNKKSAELAKENAIRELKDMKLTKEERSRLLTEIEEKYQLDLQKIADDAKVKADAKKLEDDKKEKDRAKALAEFLADTEQEKTDLRIQQEKEKADELLKLYEKDAEQQKIIKAQLEANLTAIANEGIAKQREKRLEAAAEIYNDEQKSFKERKDALDQSINEIKNATDISEEERTKKLKEYAEVRKAIDEAEADFKREQILKGLDIAAQAGALLGELAGENKKVAKAGILIEKAAAIGSIAVNTQKNAAKLGYLSPGGILELAAGAIGIATVVAQGAKAIKEIDKAGQEGGSPETKNIKSKFADGGLLTGPLHENGGILTPMGELEGGEYVVNRASTASFLPILEQINSMGVGQEKSQGNLSSMAENASMGGTPIIKTYVVASEMSSQQEADKRISDLAML